MVRAVMAQMHLLGLCADGDRQHLLPRQMAKIGMPVAMTPWITGTAYPSVAAGSSKTEQLAPRRLVLHLPLSPPVARFRDALSLALQGRRLTLEWLLGRTRPRPLLEHERNLRLISLMLHGTLLVQQRGS